MYSTQRYDFLHRFVFAHPASSLVGLVAVFAAGVLLCATIGCGRTTAVSDHSKLKLQLNRIPDAQHGGFFAALVEGHFQAEGLDVEILPGGPGLRSIPKVDLGLCDFAVGNADQVLLAREQGAEVVSVFASLQDSPRCIMVHEKLGIKSLDQLKDVTLALGEGKAFAEYLKANVPLENVRIVSYSGTIAKFLLDDNFAQQGYVFSEPLMAAKEGSDPEILMLSDIGFNPYSSLVITRQALLDEEQELVKKFVSAVRKGWKSYLEDPTAANAEIARMNSDMDVEILAKSLLPILALSGMVDIEMDREFGKETDMRLGDQSEERWMKLRDQLVELKLLPAMTKAEKGAFRGDF